MTPLLESRNFRYCIAFLRNGGERLRAIRLVIDTTGMGVREARDFVDGLRQRYPLGNNMWMNAPEDAS